MGSAVSAPAGGVTIYLDYQATTPVAPEVAAAMQPWIETRCANPHSSHAPGRAAAAAVEVARAQVMEVLGGGAKGRLHFTSGATEAANWALKGLAMRLPPDRRRIVTLATEHACVLDTARWLQAQRFDVDILPVQADGLVELGRLAESVDEQTGIVAAMLVNNEIGVIQPIAEIGAIARQNGAWMFCDAVQGVGRVELPLEACDLVALSSHKVHGPKGIGALWVAEGVELEPLIHGGGQEGGGRSGTLSPALCVGFGTAAHLLIERRDRDRQHVARLWERARVAAGSWSVNGSETQRYLGNLSLRRDGVDASRLISEVRQVAFSAGSACASGSGRPSHVLRALSLSSGEMNSTIRLGFGRYTAEENLIQALDMISDAADRQTGLYS